MNSVLTSCRALSLLPLTNLTSRNLKEKLAIKKHGLEGPTTKHLKTGSGRTDPRWTWASDGIKSTLKKKRTSVWSSTNQLEISEIKLALERRNSSVRLEVYRLK